MYAKIFSVKIFKVLLLGGFTVGILFVLSLRNEPYYSSNPLSIKPTIYSPKAQEIRASLPVRLKIPQIKLDSTIEYVGLTANGEMATTTNPSTVAWYQYGQRPGDIGSAVIAGHFGWKDNLPAAFDQLSKLQKGNKIYIEDDKGATIEFVVQNVQIFGKNDDATTIFNSNDGKSHLNLITCEGEWSNISHSYSNRLVIFSDKQ